ncbi:hypothetical protein [Saccharolobus caldissimus]|uniref:Uncharacterized protein n=1 Tax=Saccharolobus caldissimus TaxID=1702097 RepID=A0AAQ4CRU8_9CREN|nr:hypothetical protein [Saccharolobus caldissimus]BDB98529.1 hypothetical protein SACC_15460 [Saccharolobus caldissimus]
MRIKAKIDNIEDWFIIDTGFSGEVLVNYNISDKISFLEMNVDMLILLKMSVTRL